MLLFADEASLLSIFRDAVAVNFGDYGVATSAMSLSGQSRRTDHVTSGHLSVSQQLTRMTGRQ